MSWEQKVLEPEIAVCIPHSNITYLAWAIGFRKLTIPFRILYSTSRGQPIDISRNNLVSSALQHKSLKWIFFFDSDILVPSDAVLRLLSFQLPMVSAMYYSKAENWCAYSRDAGGSYHPIKSWTGTLLSVDAVGMGCCLIDKRIFEKLSPPWFNWTLGKENPGFSEDIYFCQKVKQAGFPIFVDTTIQVGHIEPMKLVGEKEAEWLEV